MNIHISLIQAQKFAYEIFISDIKKFIADRPEEYQLYLEEMALLTNSVETRKILRKEETA